MLALALRHWRLTAMVAAIALAFLFGCQVGSEYQIGRHAKAEAARVAAEQTRIAEVNRAEAWRLIREADQEAILRSITDEARSDPDGGMPALGMRDARRLNAIR